MILSPPCGGKTTLLRDIIRILSSGITEGVRGEHFEGVTVGVVDERSEIGRVIMVYHKMILVVGRIFWMDAQK